MKHYIAILFLCSYFSVWAQQDSVIPLDKAYKRNYTITRVQGIRPLMDGRIDEPFWTENGQWSEPFVQVSPYERQPSPSPTRMKLLYDDRYIYVGIYCKDEVPEGMNAFIGNRDDNSLGDLISIAFDTYHDYRAAPEFNLNLGGNRTDLIVTDKLDINRSWNAVWEGRTHINKADSSWTAELRIPFSQLRYNQLSEEGIWGLHVRRIIRRNNEVQNWSIIPLKNNGHVFSFGEMHGMHDLPKPRGIELQPYVMGKYQRSPKVAGSPYQKGNDWNGNAGLDAKVALSDFTLDITINPDYGQVELDPSVMNLTAYETFYDEKRPFFLEGKHIMDFNNGSDMMFYTRRIGAMPSYTPGGDFVETKENVPIIGALKLTGTNRNGLTLGIVQSLTARSSARVTTGGQEDKVVVEPLTNYSVARVQKNWKGNTLLGGMLTSVNRALNEQHLKDRIVRNAFTAGVDFTQYFNNRLYYIDLKAMFSSLQGSEEAIQLLQQSPVHYYQRASAQNYLGVDPTRTALNGTGGYLKVGRKGNARWSFSETFNWLSPGFDLNNVGYLKQADKLSNETTIEFKQTDTWKIFRNNTFTLTQGNQWDYGGSSYGNSLALQWKTMFINRYELSVAQTRGWNWVHTRRLRGGPDIRFGGWNNTVASFNTDKAKRMAFTLKYSADHNVRGDYRFNTLTPSLTYKWGNHVYLSGEFNYVFNTDHMEYVATVKDYDYLPPAYIVGHLEQRTYGLTMKVQVNVTPDISLQFYGSPFTSTGKFDTFKMAMDPKSRQPDERFHTFTSAEISLSEGIYSVVRSGEVAYRFKDPDFSFNEFRSNLVARWEYRPGSTLYFVWEHSMSQRDPYWESGWNDNLNRMFGLPATNVFMVKLNYWFNL
ncbi:DUF5916 domain-containing protein [Parabacteroides sp. PF5-6]|uniref:DUF5916 domain-containing protein n=1 Tax=Parabacteroides sp. PF5-6 TaxID=1742403 RepID=UPI00240617A8|nr:DUF5916 domain-containing protein [Parabacteroides sp. PF5-6]